MKKEEFTQITSNWDSHRPLLWAALEATKHLKLPVLELGCGYGSTPFLQKYCVENELLLYSYDFDSNWAFKFHAIHVTNWDNIPWRKEYGVVLVDMSPGEYRRQALMKLPNAKIIVIHDSEPKGWNLSDYQVRPLFKNFKFVLDYEVEKPGAWATALSNEINVTLFNP